MSVAEATIGHNSAAVGEILNEKPEALFTDKDMLPALLDSIEKEIADHTVDLTTEKGRKAVASLAYSIATRKNAYDKAGKKLNESYRKSIDIVDMVRRTVWNQLEALQAKARAPLDAWEQKEDDRKTKVIEARTMFAAAAHIPADATVANLQNMAKAVSAVEVDPELFGDLAVAAKSEQGAALEALAAGIARLEQAEADRAELARLRAEKDEADRKAAAKAAADAAAKADAERIAAAVKAAADKAAEAERKKAQDAIDAANAKRAKEDADREASAAAERKKAQDAIDEANRKAKAAEEALEAERRAEAKKVADAAAAKAAQDKADAARQRDQEHRSAIMREAKEAVMEHGKVDEPTARTLILAIVAGSIPNVSMEF